MARIVIFGSGVVGTATGKGLKRAGHSVEFVDVIPGRVQLLRAQGFAATEQIKLNGHPAFIFVTLPTPSSGQGYDLRLFMEGIGTIGEALQNNESFHTVVVRSTVPPGTCDGPVRELLEERSGLRAGEDFGLASNPEFLRARCASEDFMSPRVTVIGSRSRRTLERLAALLSPFGGELRVFDSPMDAELVKCAHNLFNATKISFWNELWCVAQALGTDLDPIAATVARSAEGSFNPQYGIEGGAPFGGACLPKDVNGFLGFARHLGVDTPLIRAAMEVNQRLQELLSVEPDVKPERDRIFGLRGVS